MDKLKHLKELLMQYHKIAIAYSGGVDSTFLLQYACKVLGKENVLAVTVRASVNSESEIKEAEHTMKQLGLDYVIIDADVFSIPGFKENPENRCYICKHNLFSQIIKQAELRGIAMVADGTNADDMGDYRPGLQALSELGVASPLKQCGLTKSDIREASKEMCLDTWNKPSFACLASRVPYNEEITEQKLRMLEKAEEYLRNQGFTQYRVRCHGSLTSSLARIELLPAEMNKIFDIDLMKNINDSFKKMGFKYISLDLLGYRTGSLNEVLNL